jgi:hypothetical protein
MTGRSHTDFNAETFTVAALGGALSIGGALAVGWQRYRAAQQQRWAEWSATQLQAALDCSEAMRFGLHNDLNRANGRIAELERALADRDFAFKRDRARQARVRKQRRSPRTPC